MNRLRTLPISFPGPRAGTSICRSCRREEDFTFFIDPLSGLDRIVGRHGQTEFVYRTVDTPKYHYTWMTTVEYRARFRCLSFATTAGTSFYWPVSLRLDETRDFHGLMANNPSRATIHLTEEYRLPPEIMQVGTVPLTAAIHELTDRAMVWESFRTEGPERWEWPEESGGPEVLRKIIARCRAILADENAWAPGKVSPGDIDAELTLYWHPNVFASAAR
jgi:hypothetical protein